MKKATIKRRKRVIPASQDEDGDESMEGAEAHTIERTPERGTPNHDGSVNLGMRRRPDQRPSTIEPEPGARTSKQPSPLPSASDLAAYRQGSMLMRNVSDSFNDDNRLAPLASMAAATDRQSSQSPASFSHRRKRSFSTTETEAGSADDHTKRLSSIKSILNPSTGGGMQNFPHHDGRGEYSLPPLRSPGSTIASAPSPGAFSSRGHTPSGQMMGSQSSFRDESGENDRIKLERRVTLQREAERMREMLAAKERELMELGNE